MKAKKDASERTFSLHWGSGVIEEEVQIETEYHRPTIQLLKFTAGEAAGTYSIRFCHYDLRGRFQRSPLIVTRRSDPIAQSPIEGAEVEEDALT